jgi:hypothetical protein
MVAMVAKIVTVAAKEKPSIHASPVSRAATIASSSRARINLTKPGNPAIRVTNALERSERQERAPRAETPAPVQKSGGFFGWLMGLFGGSKPAATPSTSGGGEHRHDRDGGHDGRRRNRGGRGRGRGGFEGGQNRGGGQPFQHRDPRDEEGGESRPQGGGGYQQGEPRGDGDFGGGRRRRRGGRGRFRGEGGGGGDRGGPRPEGQQGGGAI